MAACPSCGHQNRDSAKFCEECATPLAVPARLVAEERKIVTALFCDLVGFTAASELADPEDVDRMLADYFAIARAQIERHGGVVEKFIGDAVVGIFGVPAAHEDDPERAVRAGLRIVEDAEGLRSVGGDPVTLRVGIDTGEALVRLGIAPSSGEGFITGDAINTASRIQSIAPEMGVAVGLTTYEATSAVFEFLELQPATLKGKAAPVRVFHALAPIARLGTDMMLMYEGALIGRTAEVAVLTEAFETCIAGRAPRFVTVVGEPGLGKSRLVAELLAAVDARPELITWRQGRCLPFGAGITFWALGEIVKAHAGILESDPPTDAIAKLDAVLPEGDERPWFRQRLLPLLGIEATSSADREESFTAWRRFLEHIAGANPTVLVFEDLHWADDAMLTFLDDVAEQVEGVPLLVVATARPELFESHPGYGTGRNANTIRLAPLSGEDTADLVRSLLETTTISPELLRTIQDRAVGHPLYVEEFVRLLRERDLLVERGSAWQLREGAEIPFPRSIQALIAARLDALAPRSKSTLADAAVVGKVFWAGAVAELGERDLTTVIETLRELSAKKLVRPAPNTSLTGEIEYAFRHVLVRDVAYGQLPRGSRASRHVAAARWVEAKAPDRTEDLADVLAHHYATALELLRATGQLEQARELEPRALEFLALAGERALGLDIGAALANIERALLLSGPGHPRRAETLALFGQAAYQAGRLGDASEALEEAIASFREQGDLPAAARAMGTLSGVLSQLGDPRKWSVSAERLALLEPLGPSADLVGALSGAAVAEVFHGRPDVGVDYADRALTLAQDLGIPRPARALGFRAMARTDRGDAGGLDDYREAIVLATEAGQGFEVAFLHNNLGIAIELFDGPVASVRILREGIAYAEPRGLTSLSWGMAASMLDPLIEIGDHDDALEIAAEVGERLEDSGDVYSLVALRAAQARIAALRGRGSEMAGVLGWLESAARETEDPQMVVAGLGSAAIVRAGIGQSDAAAALLAEVEAFPAAREIQYYPSLLSAMARAAVAIGARDLAERLVGGFAPRTPYDEHALLSSNAIIAEARGDLSAGVDGYADAAQRWERFGVVPEHAFALLGRGRCLVNLSRPTEAAPVLHYAREIFERLQAVPALAEADALLEGRTERRS